MTKLNLTLMSTYRVWFSRWDHLTCHDNASIQTKQKTLDIIICIWLRHFMSENLFKLFTRLAWKVCQLHESWNNWTSLIRFTLVILRLIYKTWWLSYNEQTILMTKALLVTLLDHWAHGTRNIFSFSRNRTKRLVSWVSVNYLAFGWDKLYWFQL